MSARTDGRTGCVGRLVVLVSCAAVAGTLWFNHKVRLERLLTNLGGEVTYSRPANALALSERLSTTGDSGVAREAPAIVDRLFGTIVTADFGRIADLRESSPAPIIEALGENRSIQVVMLDGVPVTDADLLKLANLPSLKELGLKSTKVTASGIDLVRKQRPDLAITWVDGP